MSQNTKYEITYIIRPNIDEEAKTALVERFDTILKDNGAEIIDSKIGKTPFRLRNERIP